VHGSAAVRCRDAAQIRLGGALAGKQFLDRLVAGGPLQMHEELDVVHRARIGRVS
jgi:hypothetical protein